MHISARALRICYEIARRQMKINSIRKSHRELKYEPACGLLSYLQGGRAINNNPLLRSHSPAKNVAPVLCLFFPHSRANQKALRYRAFVSILRGILKEKQTALKRGLLACSCYFVRGLARTQVPTNRNYTLELPTFGVIAGVSTSEVQC